MKNPVSLYIHVPFCAHKCGYCDFYSKTSLVRVGSFCEALHQEIAHHKQHNPLFFSNPIETIFFGGGTPSILTPNQFTDVAKLLTENFNLSQLKEWTIEVNPESFNERKAKAWHRAGVNRLSVGVQSLDAEELKLSERIHSAETAIALFENPILDLFDSVSADVIYGLPGQTKASLQNTVAILTKIPSIKHIAAYELNIAEGTPFDKTQDVLPLPQEELIVDLTQIGRDAIRRAGFKRYEVSNFAKSGHASLHNQNYWNFTPYLGLGPSAHSFDGTHRWGNVASQSQWEEKLSEGSAPYNSPEELSKEMLLEEYLMLRFRTSAGIDALDFKARFREPFDAPARQKSITSLQDEGFLSYDDGRWFLSDAGMDRADGIAVLLG